MTAPEDDLEQTLRQALAEAVGQVQPGADGLERIRARISNRPPRPWLLSVAHGVYDRARNWTWRGHWAWRGALALPAVPPWPRLLRLQHSPTGTSPRISRPAGGGWLRPVAVLAGIAVIASISLGVQPFRQALIQASNTVTGDGQQTGSAGTDGNAKPAATGTSSSAAGAVPDSSPSPGHAGTTMTSGSPTPTAASPTRCPANEASLTATAPSTAAGLPTTIPSALPYYSSTPSPTCAAATPSGTPTPTVSTGSTSASASPSASATSPSPTSSPSATPTPTPTSASPTPTATPTPTDSPSGSPSPTATDTGGTSAPPAAPAS